VPPYPGPRSGPADNPLPSAGPAARSIAADSIGDVRAAVTSGPRSRARAHGRRARLNRKGCLRGQLTAGSGDAVEGGLEFGDPGPGAVELVLQLDDPRCGVEGHALVEQLPHPGRELQLAP